MTNLGCAITVAKTLLTVAASIVVLYIFIQWAWYQWTNRRIIAFARTLPTVFPTLPLLGHAYKFSSLSEASTKYFLQCLEVPTHQPSSFWIGPVPYIVLHRYEDIQEFFRHTKINDKPSEYNLFNFGLGVGLITAPHRVWKKTRRHLNPVFHPRNLDHLMAAFDSSTSSLISELAGQVGNGPFDVHGALVLLATRNAFYTAFGPDFKMHNDQDHALHFSDVTQELNTVLSERILKPWLWVDLIFYILYASINKRLDDMYNTLMKPKVVKILQECDKAMDKEKDSYDIIGKGQPLKLDETRPVTIPEAFYKLQEVDLTFSDHSYMKGELTTIISADRLFKEVIEVVGRESGSISMNDINKMSYMDQVIKESMRRFIIVPFVARKSDGDIKINGLTIPAGATIVLSLSSLHMDPNIYREPTGFDPDHFNPESIASKEKYTFLPFSGGVRDCIGKHYAMIQMKMVLAHIIRRYRIHSCMDMNNMRFSFGIIKTCIDGYYISIQNRDDADFLTVN